MLKFKWVMDCGDATSNYDVTCEPGMTVADFCREVLKREEWGDISVCTDDGRFLLTIMEYRGENFAVTDQELFHKYLGATVKSVWANGGWGSMNYYITLAERQAPKDESLWNKH